MTQAANLKKADSTLPNEKSNGKDIRPAQLLNAQSVAELIKQFEYAVKARTCLDAETFS